MSTFLQLNLLIVFLSGGWSLEAQAQNCADCATQTRERRNSEQYLQLSNLINSYDPLLPFLGECSEASAAQGRCGALDSAQLLKVAQMIGSITDCLPLRKVLERALNERRIRVVESLPRAVCLKTPVRLQNPIPNASAIATTHTIPKTIILSLSSWDTDDPNYVKVLRHEGGHLLYPNGAVIEGVKLSSEQMAQTHGTCFVPTPEQLEEARNPSRNSRPLPACEYPEAHSY